MSEAFDRGHVVWHDRLFRGSDRPWLVVSDDSHPFHGEEYLVVGITTTERDNAIEITDEDWSVGGLPKQSYVSPWFITTIKHASIYRGVGELDQSLVSEIVTEASRYIS